MKLAVLGSTNGTDLDAIIAAIKNQEIDASIEVVISNVKSSGILAKAKKYYIDYYYISHKNKKRDVFDHITDVGSSGGVYFEASYHCF